MTDTRLAGAVSGSPVTAPQRRWWPWTVVAAVAVLALHVAAVAAMRTVAHDDAISYLAATGHQGAYAEALADPDGPTTRWVPASEWKSYFQVDDRLVFSRIRADLGQHDIHPPLYFWLLHLVVLAFGVHVGTGPAANLVLHVITAVLLWHLARRVFVRGPPAAAAVLLWAVSPAVISTGLATRPYTLMTLATVVLVLLALRAAEPGPPGDYMRPSTAVLLGIAAVSAAGLASQFQFGVVLAVVGAWVALRRLGFGGLGGGPGEARTGRASVARARQAIGAVATVAAAMVAGALVAAAITGDVAAMVERQRDQAETLTSAEFALRVPRVPTALAEFVWLDPPAVAGLVIGVALAVAGLAAAFLLLRASHRGELAVRGIRPVAALAAVWCFLALAVGILGVYLAGVSPRFAVEPRYLAPVWPFAAVTLVVLWQVVSPPPPRRRDVATGWAGVAAVSASVLGVAVIVMMLGTVRPLVTPSPDDPSSVIADVDRVVTDNIARGVLPRIVWHLPDDMPVRADSPSDLARESELFSAPEETVLYISVPGYEVDAEGRDRVLRAARDHGTVTQVRGSVWGIGQFFMVR